MNTEPKTKICSATGCENEYVQYNSLQPFCSYDCQKKHQVKKPKAKRTAINKIGKKQAALLQKYGQVRRAFLSYPENQYCPVTGFRTTEIHHKKGKIGFGDDWARRFNVPLLIDERYFLAVHRQGHNKIEANPAWAKKMGYSENRLETIK